ncbi:hypothetical protein [Paractinoplanes hotanensis]|uniref:Uncharacterized protein n=1 Tax=Paractinoplanes hotanensis TaxID=2906497 RepID=A0ABT0XW52_9ACTN|nr:hypothetical protein [Actinoplanes hotanensis]MCM4078022.1 hypothetical protein [Actinoplanes hotanensis]
MDLLAQTFDTVTLLSGLLGAAYPLIAGIAAAPSRFPLIAPLLGALLVTVLA